MGTEIAENRMKIIEFFKGESSVRGQGTDTRCEGVLKTRYPEIEFSKIN